MSRVRRLAALATSALLVMSSAALAQTRRATGLIFLDQGQYQSIPPAPPPLSGQPPATIDLSSYGYFPEPGDQGDQGSCVGWAVAYGLKSYQKNREFRLQGLNSNFRFSPAFVYNQVKQNGCQGGSSIRDAMNIVESQGALPLDTFEYDEKLCDRLPTEGQVQSAWEYRIAKWMRVNVQSLAEMKAQLVRGFPVVVAMEVHQAFADWTGGGVYDMTRKNAGASLGGHAMVVVGYADQLKAFKVLNSWGTKWGDGGYAWIDYATFQNLTLEGYVTIDIFLDRVASTTRPANIGGPRSTSEPGRSTTVAVPAVTPPDGKAAAPPPTTGTSTTPSAPPTSRTSAPPPVVPASTPAVSPMPVPANRTAQTITPETLTAAVRSTTEPKLAFQWNGYSVLPYSVWLELPDTLSAAIRRTEYWFNHPSFKNPKVSMAGSNIFIAKWQGYGCINDAKVIAFLKDGRRIEAPFDLCAAQGRF